MPYADPERQREALRDHYKKNKPKYVAKSQQRNKRLRNELRNNVYEYLLQHPCVDCGEDDPVVLDFDHVGEKRFNISDAVAQALSWETILAEIAKCEIRCANCHRRRTAKQLGSSRLRT